jgi:hypothetical protein
VAKGPGTWVAGAALGSPPGRRRASWRSFVLSFAGATVLGVALLAPLERWESRGVLLAVVALAGIALAAIAFASLAVSESSSLFGFHEPGYDPTAITVSRVAELATVALLGAYVVARFVAQVSIRRW